MIKKSIISTGFAYAAWALGAPSTCAMLEIGEVSFELLHGGTNLVLGWPSEAESSYGVETSINLVFGDWGPLRMGISGTGGSVGYTGTVSLAKQFFRVVGITAPGFGIHPAGLEREPDDAVTVAHEGETAVTRVASLYKHLDLDAQTKAMSLDPTASPLVPLGPRLVAGEGPHPDNHTIIRILTEYQIPEVQFLAFPPAVRGGVGVNCGNLGGELAIVAHPLSGSLPEIRVFDRFGGHRFSVQPDQILTPPYAVAVGDFIEGVAGDEVAVAGRFVDPAQQAIPILIYGGDGGVLKQLEIDRGSAGGTTLNFFAKAMDDGTTYLVVYDQAEKRAHSVEVGAETVDTIDLSGIPDGFRLHGSAYSDREFNAGGDEDLVSTLYAVPSSGMASAINAGSEENIFWFAHPDWAGETNRAAYSSGTYIKRGRFKYMGNMVQHSEVAQSGLIEGRSYAEWASTNLHDWVMSELANQYDSGVPKIWSPSFTHRWFFGEVDSIVFQTDDIYHLPRYLALDRSNTPIQSGYHGQISFDLGSYAYEHPGLNDFYTYGIREGLKQIAVRARENPNKILGIEPNHENEIVTGENDGVSFGDYNPRNIAGFYRYLLFLYGSLDNINQRFGTPFTRTFFDAPRDLGRGGWDAYGNAEGFSQAWYDYNASVVYRRVGDSYREALLAGFPPEMITCHMVPDSYSQKVEEIGFDRESPRITPIDWMMTSGTSFGCSRYGNWYRNEYNAANGLWSSGFSQVSFVEYSPFTSSDEHAYNQLLYLMTNGVYYIGGFASGASLNPQKNALLRVIQENDQPRRGHAGGISEVRPFTKEQEYDIVALGTGEMNTGLIKSIKPTGTFEGTVYVAPFHARVDISTLVTNENITLITAEKTQAVVDDPYFGMQVEFVFSAFSNLEANNGLRFNVYHDDMADPLQTVTVPVNRTERNYRVIHKLTLPTGALTYKIETATGKAIQIKGMNAYLHEEKAIRLRREVYLGERHKGGVTFDILE